MSWPFWLTLILFSATYFGQAVGKIPGLRMDRAGIALVGATLVLVTGLLTFDQAVASDCIDYKTLALLFGMMVVVGFLRLSGVFEQLSAYVLCRIRSPRGLLAVTIFLSGVLSAFLINDIVCLALTPLILHLAKRLGYDPLPHLIALATAANIGSTGTITGNPQNIFIGSHSGISYLRFAACLLPVAGIGLVICFLVIAWCYRARLVRPTEHSKANPQISDEDDFNGNHRAALFWLRRKALLVATITVILFFTGLPLELIALGAAAVMLVSRVKPQKVFGQIDWSLLILFTGLFIVVHAFQVHVVSHWDIEHWDGILTYPVGVLGIVSAVLSNFVSNVPAVLLLEPVLAAVPPASRETAWLTLAMSSTLAGNLTILGSVANLIVVECARRERINVSFWDYCKVGIPLTILTLAVGIVWLSWVW